MKKHLNPLFSVIALCLFVIGVWNLNGQRVNGAGHDPLPSLQGKAAVDYLKAHGLAGRFGPANDLAASEAPEALDASFVQVKKVAASDAAAADQFGDAIAVSGDTAVIGAFNKGTRTGAAYVYERNRGGVDNWGQVKKIAASDAATMDDFGKAVAISGDTILIGAPNKASATGAAYVYERNRGGADNWGQVKKIMGSGAAPGDAFGQSVTISGDTAAVGADGSTTSGAVFIFGRNQGSADNWGEVIKVTPEDGAANDLFGAAISLSNDTLAAGAFGKSTETGAVYIFERNQGGANNWGQVRKITASDSATNDRFGFSVSISGDAVAAGAYKKSGATGAAYVYARNQGGVENWGEVKKIIASDGSTGAEFGVSVSISNDTVAVGARNQNDRGALYVYERNRGGADNWGENIKLAASDGATGDSFGGAVSISGDTLVGGAPLKSALTGAAYIFANQCTDWVERRKPVGGDIIANDFFGYSTAISGDTVVVGAYNKNLGSGVVYVFERNQGGADNWGQTAELLASNGTPFYQFGFSVAISGDTIVAGSNGKAAASGAVYIFSRNLGGPDFWGEVKKVKASDFASNDEFGISVSISGDSLAVGAISANASAGATYVFERNQGGVDNWGEVKKITASDTGAGDRFGTSVSISGDTIVASASNQNSNTGAAYLFTRNQGGADNWGQVKKIIGGDVTTGDRFGSSVAISHDLVVVGANFKDGFAGTAYLFARNQGGADNWGQVKKLTSSDPAALDVFGNSVSLSTDMVVVGAYNKNSSRGAAYVFERNQGGADNWGEVKKITASDAAANDNFGFTVSISGDTLVSGAYGHNTSSGSAYIFTLNCPPSVTGVSIERTKGSPASVSTIALVDDDITPPGALTVTTTPPTGIIITDLTNTDGVITANVAADCAAATGNNVVGLKVTDGHGLMKTGSFTVNVAPNPLPVLSYSNPPSVNAGDAIMISPATGPSDNGSVLSLGVESVVPTFNGTISVDGAGVVSVSNARPGGNFTVTVRATDNCNAITDATFTLNVICPTITIGPATPPAGTVNAAYNQILTGNGGLAPYSFGISAGALPNGMVLSLAGTLVGTPTQSGTFNFTVSVTDANGCTGTQALALTINCQTITVNPPTLSNGFAGVAYSQTFTAANAIGTPVFSATGTLPNGLTLSPAGLLSGTPTQIGPFNFSVKATDANNCVGTQSYTLTINCPAINIAPSTLPNGSTVAPYSQQLMQTGGVGAISWSSTGTLPGGLTLNPTTGLLSGMPTATGMFNFTVRATDANLCFGERNYTMTVTICPIINISPSALPNGAVGAAYNQPLTASGGTPGYNFTLDAGTLPTGVTLSSGALTGTPSAAGSFTFTIRATDANNCTATRQYTIIICATITISPVSAANGFVGVVYNQPFTQTGGIGTITWSSIGILPNGLTLNATTGVLTGTPTTQTTFTFTIRATDVNACFGERSYTVIISGSGPNSLMFYPLPSPVRLLDTRPGASPNACTQPNTPIAGGTSLTQSARSFCGLPAGAKAITGNVTTVQSGGGFLTLYPSDAAQPTVASTNYGANEAINNVFTVGLGAADGAFKIFALNTTDVVVDVTGYYAPPATGGLYFHTLPAPVRLLETRAGQAIGCVLPGAPLTGGQDSLQTAVSACTGIPAAARAIVGNATTVSPQSGGFLTLFPADATRPTVASSNYNFNQVVNGPFTVGLSATGQFKIFTLATTELIVDVLGYYSTEAADANGAGLLFSPLAHPIRLLETRSNPPNLTGCFKPNAPLNGTQIYTQSARGLCDGLTVPGNALGVVGNATVVTPLGGGFLTLWPSATAQPTAATANYGAGGVVNRHFIVGLGNLDGSFKMFSAATTELVIDLSGYFAP